MKKLAILALLLTGIAVHLCFAQKTITGTVTDLDNGTTLPGVSIRVKGTVIGTITDFDGKYKLANVPENATTLVFSFVGMKTKEVPIEGNKPVDVKLETDTKGIEEVVVVGYGVTRKSDLTGAVASVKSEEITKAPVVGVDQALQGRAAGVQVTSNTGSPGAGISVRIRGINTINDMDPLYVVDGLPTTSIGFLNPNDIESIEILKDASAAAIYGARAANGVVLISTKKGQTGKVVVSFDGYRGMQSVWKEPDLLTGPEYYDVMSKAYLQSYGENGKKFKLQETADDPTHTTNWFDEISRVAPIENYNISFSGGSKISTYNISGSYFNQEGTIKKSDYQRYTFRINTNNRINNYLTVGNNFTLTNTRQNSIAEGDYYNGILNSALKLDPLTPVRNENGDYVSSPYTDVQNPVAHIDHDNKRYDRYYATGNVFAEIEIIEGLKIKSDYGLYLYRRDTYDYDPVYFLAPDEQNPISKVSRGYSRTNRYNWANTITYSKKLMEKHKITLLAGTEAVGSKNEWLEASADSTIADTKEFWYLDSGIDTENDVADGSASEWYQMSYFGRLNYNFDDKYLFTATVRRDGSSRFGEGYRWGMFPSFSAGWNISNESFMETVPQLSTLKLRFGWGKLGNDQIGLYQYSATVNYSERYTYVFSSGTGNGGSYLSYGAAPSHFGNKDIHWEEQVSSNFGVDFGLLENKITGSADYFVKQTNDMLYYEPVPDYTGYLSVPATNIAKMENKGWEFSVNYRGKVGDLTYKVGFNVSHFKAEVLELGEDNTPLWKGTMRDAAVCKTAVGGEPGAFVGYITDGIFQNEQEIEDHVYTDPETGKTKKLQPKAIPGDIRFKDIGSFDDEGEFIPVPDGVINDADRDYIGSPNPDLIYGLNLEAAYKGFDLSLFFQGTQGNDIFNFMIYYTMSTSDVWNKDSRILNAWDGEGSSNDVPIINYKDKNQNLRFSDRYIEDGSYLRLKTIQLGYSLPQSILSKIGLSKFRLYVGGQNLLTFTKYPGMDPEIGKVVGYGSLVNGIDIGTYPNARVMLIGANISF